MVEQYGTALVPDFQEHYGLQLSRVVLQWSPVEVLLLIRGLPETSRYHARLAGDSSGRGWDRQDWLALDTRNALEGLRATVVSAVSGKKRNTFRDWEHYPGREAVETQQRKSKLSKLDRMAVDVTD